MGTASSKEIRDEATYGIVPRVIRELFATISERQSSAIYTVRVAFLGNPHTYLPPADMPPPSPFASWPSHHVSCAEIYNDDIIDLLASASASSSSSASASTAVAVPTVRELSDGSIAVANVVEEEVKSYEAMMKYPSLFIITHH